MNNYLLRQIIENKKEVPHEAEVSDALPWSAFAKKLMNSEDFVEYINAHGYHFTPCLADCATKMMVNANGEEHNWTTEQVKKAMTGLGMSVAHDYTWGDAAYAANQAYADDYPTAIKTEADCLQHAHNMMHDPDGYGGMIFSNWLNSVISTQTEIDWHKHV